MDHDPGESFEAGELFKAQHLPPGKRDLISTVRDLSSWKALWTDGTIIHAILQRFCRFLTLNQYGFVDLCSSSHAFFDHLEEQWKVSSVI